MNNTNVSLFPARIASRVVKVEEIPAYRSGSAGGYAPLEDKVYIPVADTAFARIVRLHESGHAIWSRETRILGSDYVAQAVEDAMVHTKLATTGSVRRDELAVAAGDVRAAGARVAQGERDRARQGLAILRAASILVKANSSKVISGKLAQVAAKYHKQGMELVDAILAEVRAGEMEAARALTSTWMRGGEAEEEESKPEPDGGASPEKGESEEGEAGESESESGEDSSAGEEGKGESGSGDSSEGTEDSSDSSEAGPSEPKADKPSRPSKAGADRGVAPGVEPVEPVARKFKPGKVEELPDAITGGDEGDYISNIVKVAEKLAIDEAAKRDCEDGSVTAVTGEHGEHKLEKRDGRNVPFPIMYVHTLAPDAARRVKGRGHAEWRSASEGLKIRTNRLALNAANPCGGARLFQTRRLGGTVLIDASGSMYLTDRMLYTIAEKFPAGKVAYYSGRQDTWEDRMASNLYEYWSGDLVVYVQNGRIRTDRGGKLPLKRCGNLVDLAAISWLLKQPGPRYLLFDRGYTGTAKMRKMAQELLAKAEAKGLVEVFRTVKELMASVGKLK